MNSRPVLPLFHGKSRTVAPRCLIPEHFKCVTARHQCARGYMLIGPNSILGAAGEFHLPLTKTNIYPKSEDCYRSSTNQRPRLNRLPLAVSLLYGTFFNDHPWQKPSRWAWIEFRSGGASLVPLWESSGCKFHVSRLLFAKWAALARHPSQVWLSLSKRRRSAASAARFAEVDISLERKKKKCRSSYIFSLVE